LSFPNNMKKFIPLILLMFPLVASCGSKRTFETQAPTQNLAGYTILEIPDFHSNVEGLSPDTLWTMPNQIAKELRNDNTFTGVSRAPLDISNGVLILDGTITEVKPREWYKQAVSNVRVVVKVRLIDKSESLVIAEAYFEGTASWGVLSGGKVVADMRLINEITDYLKQNYPNSNRPRR